MVRGRLEEITESRELTEELINKTCHLAMKAHKSTGKQYISEKKFGSSEAIFGFAGSWSAGDWFSRKPFGQTDINLDSFPSLRSIGNDEIATVNEAFVRKFEAILRKSALANEVEKAVTERKKVVFTGHSSGGPMAILATLWFLEKCIRTNHIQISPLCVTFGSPLAGDRIFPHALGREKWARYFINFVMRYDIIPRMMLSPLSQIELQPILDFMNPRSPFFQHESIAMSDSPVAFFAIVMRNASSVASHAACKLMGCTNSLLETVASFAELSPYRPFGTYIFCTGNGKLVVVKNPDAVLQLLFYSLQLSSEAEGASVAYRSLKEHWVYERELKESLEMQNVVCLDHLEELPLSSNGSTSVDTATTNTALNDLGLSTTARLCLRAAGELEKQKLKNQATIDSKKIKIEEVLNMIQHYQTGCLQGYYDAFKLQKETKDFNANVKRLELTGIMDEIIEMLKRNELPDGFEGRKEWIELGTKYRRLMEPLDIANYYRHSKNDDTGAYMNRGRPKRYKYTQRWREHAEKMQIGSSSESYIWAKVEELRTSAYEDMKQEIQSLEGEISKWVSAELLGKDVFFDGSTFTEWWKTLPNQHRSESCLVAAGYMSN